MSDSTRNQVASVATIATANVQSIRYTDARVQELSARIDAVQVTVRTNTHRTEVKRARAKLTDRLVAIAAMAIVGIILARCALPHLVTVALASCPECAREVYEFARKL